jgi:O-antigen/teichoic acid export membrane protein
VLKYSYLKNVLKHLLFLAKSKIRLVIGSSLLRSSGIYTISSFLYAAIPFLLLPILTKYLSPEDFGVITMFNAAFSFALPLIGFNMEGAIARKFFSKKDDFAQYVGGTIITSFFLAILVFVICYSFLDQLQNLIGIPAEWILLGILMCYFQFIITVWLVLNQVKQKPIYYGVSQVLLSTFNFSLTIILIVFYKYSWDGRLIAQLLVTVLIAVIILLILIIKRDVKFVIKVSQIKYSLEFGGGLIPHAFGMLLISYTNRFFLKNMVSLGEAGLYSVATQIASIISFFTLSFNNAFVPWLYDKLNLNNIIIKIKIVKLTYGYFAAILIFGLIFYLSSPLIFKLFVNKNFDQSNKYVPWIILGFVFQGMYFMVTNYINYSEKTYYQGIITLSVGVTNIALNYIFIHFFGPIGSAIAFSFSFFLLFIATWIFSAKIYPMPWRITIHNYIKIFYK